MPLNCAYILGLCVGSVHTVSYETDAILGRCMCPLASWLWVINSLSLFFISCGRLVSAWTHSKPFNLHAKLARNGNWSGDKSAILIVKLTENGNGSGTSQPY